MIFIPLMKISPVRYSSRVSAKNTMSTIHPFASGIEENPKSMHVPKPYIGRYGPLRKPGLIHLFALNILRKNSSVSQPAAEPIINRNESSKNAIIIRPQSCG